MMKTPLTTLFALSAAFSTTLSAGSLAAQNPTAEEVVAKALEQGILLEEQEHDLQKAADAYRAIATNEAASAGIRSRAWFRLGKVLQRLGRMEEGRAALKQANAFDTEAGQAAGAMLDQDPDDAARARALRLRARAILDDDASYEVNGNPAFENRNGITSEAWDNLAWIGAAAAPEILAEATKHWAARGNDASVLVNGFCRLAFRLGGLEAEGFLAAATNSDDVEWRRVVAGAMDGSMASDAFYVFGARFLADADEQVAKNALQDRDVVRRFPMGALVRTLYHPSRAVRKLGYQLFAIEWSNLRHYNGSESETMALILPKLEMALSSIDPELGRDAMLLFSSHAMLSTHESRSLLLRMIPRIEVDRSAAGIFRRAFVFQLTDADEHVDELVTAAERLGPVQPNRGRAEKGSFSTHDWQVFLEQWMVRSVGSWGREALPGVAQLVSLGYDSARLRDFVIQYAMDEDALVLARLLPYAEQPEYLLRWLSHRELPVEAWPFIKPFVGKMQKGEAMMAAGQTGAAEAVAELARWAQDSREDVAARAALGLIFAIRRTDGPAVRSAVRDVAARGETTRRPALAELIRVGDESVEALLRQYKSVNGGGSWGLSLVVDPARSGFGPAEAAALVRSVLTPDATALWSDLSTSSVIWDQHSPSRVSPEVRAALVDACIGAPPKVTGGVFMQLMRDDALAVAKQVLAREDVTSLHANALDALRSYSEQAPEWLTFEKVEALAREAAGANGERMGKQLLWLARDYGWLGRNERSVVRILSKASLADLRRWTLDAAAEAQLIEVDDVMAALADESEEVRAKATEVVLGDFGLASEQVVARLLSLAGGDVDHGVRVKARETLDALRTYQEQKAHWDRVFSGVNATPASAAEALLRQAKGGKKEVRVLAIRSLGSLGAPETLPFLIEWTQAEDPEIAAAALAAVQLIHRKGG